MITATMNNNHFLISFAASYHDPRPETAFK
jgi:hypothetical protein